MKPIKIQLNGNWWMFWRIKEDVISKLSVSKQKQKTIKFQLSIKSVFSHILKKVLLKCSFLKNSLFSLNEGQKSTISVKSLIGKILENLCPTTHLFHLNAFTVYVLYAVCIETMGWPLRTACNMTHVCSWHAWPWQ